MWFAQWTERRFRQLTLYVLLPVLFAWGAFFFSQFTFVRVTGPDAGNMITSVHLVPREEAPAGQEGPTYTQTATTDFPTE